MKKIVVFVAIVVFIGVTFYIGSNIYKNIYFEKVSKELQKQGLNIEDYDIALGMSEEDIRALVTETVSKEQVEVENKKTEEESSHIEIDASSAQINTEPELTKKDVYECTDDTTVKSRGYILLHGAGGPDAFEQSIENLVKEDVKYGGFLYFTYNSTQEDLETISSRFVIDYNNFSAGFDEVIVFGQSAGGVIVSQAAHILNTPPILEVHTLASPLNGYKFGATSEALAQGLQGLNKEIALGFNEYVQPSANVTVYHHKTKEDAVLRSFCGSFSGFCSPSVVQDNNVPGSIEYQYPNDTHDSIVSTVAGKVLGCKK